MPRRPTPPHGPDGRFVAERTTTTITERLTIEEHHHPGTTTPTTGAAPIFAALLNSPPDGARWASPEFIAVETARAVAADAARREAFTRPLPLAEVAWTLPEIAVAARQAPLAVLVPRVYRELDPDTLAHEFADTPLDLLP